MYEKNADIMDSLRNAKDSVSDGAMRLLQKLKGSSQNDIDNAVSSQLPLADKATKLLGEGGRLVGDKVEKSNAPSALSYIPGIGGYLGGLSKPTPGRGRLVSALGEGVSGNLGGTLGGATGAFGGAALGGIGALLAKVLSKGRINLGREAILGGAFPGGMVGNSLGTHAGAGLFHDMAAKSAEHKDSAASGLAYVPGVGGSLDGFFNPIPGRGRLVSAMGEGQMASRFGASSGLLGGMGGATVGTAGALLALLLSKGKLNPRASLALGLGGPLGGAAAGGLVGNSIGTHAGANLFREMAAKEGSWADAPSFSANMAMPNMAMPNKTNPFLQGNKPSTKADAAGIEKAQAKLASQDNCSPSRSSAGDSKGVKYKQQTEDHATGTAAFDSLDKYLRMAKIAALESSDKKKKKIKWYGITLPEDQKRIAEEKYYEMNSSQDNKNKAIAMAMDKYKEMSKKAGLNDFQTNFFGRLIQEGINEHEMYEAIKQAGDQFGYKVGKELNRGLEKLSNWGAIGKGLMTGAKYLGAAGLGAGAGVAASGAVQQGVKDAVGQGVKDGVKDVGNNAINSAGNFMNNAANSAGNFMGNMANTASNFMGNAMGNPSQNGDNMHRARSNILEPAGNPYQAVRSNIPEPAGNPYQAMRSNIPNTNGNPFQNVLNAGMQHLGNMATGAQNMMGTNGLGGGFTGNGIGKQSREKRAVNWAGMAQAAAKYLGTGLARPGAAVKNVYDTARNAYAGPLAPSISRGIKGVLNDKTMRSQMWTGAGTGATNPFTGAFTPSDDPNAGWGDYAARVGGSALAGAGAGLLGGKGVQDVMKRMYAGSLAGSTADLGAGAFGIDTGGLGGKAGFLGAGISPAKMPKFLGQAANRFAGGTDDIIRTGRSGNVFTVPGRQGDTVTALSKLDPFSLVGSGYTKFVKPNVRPALDAMKNNRGLTAGIGLGTAGIGTGAYIGNKAVSGINDASERMNAQMNMLRNETNNNLSGIRQDLGGGMGGIGQFFEENKHWLMPALLAGGGALAGGALGGQSGAAMGGLSLPALYMMHQNGMFGGGAAANPLQAPPAKADYIQRQQQHEQEQINDQIAARSRDPRLAGPIRTPTPPMPKSTFSGSKGLDMSHLALK